ncbi:MAG: hypothetical protein WBP86_09830 [Thiobacillaceae bacterium]
MKTQDMRRLIAFEAARQIAGDGGLDYGAAKRKAARRLGAPDSRNLPDNQEIEEALRSYQSLYQGDVQRNHLSHLRRLALEYMTLLEAFDPHLTGPVLTGTAGRHSDINLQLFGDDEKELAFFLLNRRIDYTHGEAHFGQTGYPSFRIHDPRATLELVLCPRAALGQLKRNQADGSPRRVRLAQVKALLSVGP